MRDGLGVLRPRSPESLGDHRRQQRREHVVVGRHVHDAQREPRGERVPVAPRAIRAEQEDLCASHECRADEFIAAALLVIAIDEHEPRPNAQERAPRGLVVPRKVGRVLRQFDDGAKQRGGQRVRREYEYGLSAHVVVELVESGRKCEANEGDAARRGPPVRLTCIHLALDVRLANLNIRRCAIDRCSHRRSHLSAGITPPLSVQLMMMAYDSSHTPPSRLAEDTIDAVRVALREYLASGSSALLQVSLVRMASDAREKAMLPEHVLLALKEVWHDLPEVRAMGDASEKTRLLQRVVTMCIKEYYSA